MTFAMNTKTKDRIPVIWNKQNSYREQ